MQQWKKDSDLSIDNKSNISKSINSNSISSIEINTSKIYEVIEDENISENTIIDNDLDINSITCYYSRANNIEGKSVARGLPLFIRDFFKLEPVFSAHQTF